jgi:hypothetical protein
VLTVSTAAADVDRFPFVPSQIAGSVADLVAGLR